MFQERGTPAKAIVGRIGFRLFCEDNGGHILDEIHAAAVAFSTMQLLMVARRTLERKCCVASRTEAGAVRCLDSTFGTFHDLIVEGRDPMTAA